MTGQGRVCCPFPTQTHNIAEATCWVPPCSGQSRRPVVLRDMMVKHSFSGSCRGGPLDGQSLEHHQNVYRIFEPPSYELLGEYWHQDGKWVWRPSNRTNDLK